MFANTSANFPDPVDGVITAAGITFAAPTAAYSDVAPYFVLREPSAGPTWYVGAFPDGQSCLNLAAARLRHIAGSAWSTKRYMNMQPLYQSQAVQTGAVA